MAKDKNDKNNKNGKFPKGTAAAFHAVKMLEGIPEDLKDLFVPETKDGLDQLEINIVKWRSRVQERQKVMQLQKRHNLPLRPNQTLRDVYIRIKIKKLKERRDDDDNSGYDSDDPYQFGGD